jgi:hypothetical protein
MSISLDIAWKDGSLTQATVSSDKGGVANVRVNGKKQSITVPAMGNKTIGP